MRVLLDECVDWRLSRDLIGHDVRTARQMGWQSIKNGELLALATDHFDVFVTVDRNLAFQQAVPDSPLPSSCFAGERTVWRICALFCPTSSQPSRLLSRGGPPSSGNAAMKSRRFGRRDHLAWASSALAGRLTVAHVPVMRRTRLYPGNWIGRGARDLEAGEPGG